LARHYNGRRWLSFDLLMGRVDEKHPWHARFLEAGVPRAEMDEFLGEPRGPMLLGINHYATSDRFLDHRTGLYPAHLSDPNEPDAFVDTEAVRALVPVSEQGWLPRPARSVEALPGGAARP
jgi:dTDP-4-dehydrorhamnose reductase